MIKRMISLGLIGLTVGTLWSLNKQLRQSRRHESAKAKPVPVQTWEGEGGALPVTGAQTGPDPSIAQTTTQKADEAQGIVH
jgi:hypothetical protein